MDAFIAGLQNSIATKILEMFPGPRNLLSLQTIAARIDSRISTHRQFFYHINIQMIIKYIQSLLQKRNLQVTIIKLLVSFLKKTEKEELEIISFFIVQIQIIFVKIALN